MSEHEVRFLRDRIYGQCTNHNWNECKANWMRPDSVRWLQEQVKKLATITGEMK